MTTQSQIPLKWYVPFAQGDASRVELPVTTADPTRASQTLGFPPLTMQPPESGGVPPQGEDFNGGMNQVARVAWWTLLGGGWTYDAAFATNANIGGYPNGAVLQSADLKGNWLSIADNNQNNPDTGSGTAWVPGFQYGSTSLTGLTGGTVTLTPAQAAKGSISLAGTLGSALTIVLPAWQKNWSITNNTTGAFVTIAKTAAGSGVTIPQNGAPTRVSGDGTNVTQVGENIAAATSLTQAMQLGQATGRLINVQVFSTAGTATYTPTAGTTQIIVDVVGGGGGGGGTATTGASQGAIGSGGSSGSRGVALIPSSTYGTSQTVTVGAAGAFGGVSGNGGNGGQSSFGALVVAPGGGGGAVGLASTAPFLQLPSAPGGVATFSGTLTQILNCAGNPGTLGACSSLANGAISGGGGHSPQSGGGGGRAIQANSVGQSATSAGAGGSGAALLATQAGTTGGAGGAGRVIVYEYA
jgi:hypothetical protein